jgi:hypothetical protein
MNSLIHDIGRSYIVSSFIPAVMFTALAAILLSGFLPQSLADRIIDNNFLLSNALILYSIITAWIAFTLYSIVDWTVKLFEGYKLPKGIANKWKNSNLIHLIELNKIVEEYNHEKTVNEKLSLVDPEFAGEHQNRLFKMKENALAAIHELEIRMPLDPVNLKPTALGNILAAAEMYPMEKYRMDGIIIWPRLYKVLPKEFRQEEEEKNNQLVFILNSTFLSVVLGIFLVAIGLFGHFNFWLLNFRGIQEIPTSFYFRGFETITPWEYVAIGIIFLVLSRFLYQISLHAAEDHSLIVRAGFDLYRFELLKQMNYPIPRNRNDEINAWKSISTFLVAGFRLGREEVTVGSYTFRKELLDSIPAEVEEIIIEEPLSWWKRIFAG